MIDTLYKIVAFAVTLGVLVVFHELGHYVVARLAGVKVLRFSVGFGRMVWSRRLGRDHTEWALSAIPLGGYVKMVDEREGHVDRADLPRAFNRQSVWRRIAIVAAGPLANLLLAVVLFAGTYVAGIPGQRALLAEPPPSTPAAAADVRAGDRVVAVDGEPVGSWQELRWRVVRAQGHERVTLSLVRDNVQDGPIDRELSLAGMDTAEWEGNPLATLGLRADLGAPIAVATA
jgi:regulator of sigma E protease